MPRLVLALLCCLFPIDALAQVYIGGGAGAGTLLLNQVDLLATDSGGGTVPSVAVRVGIALGGRWGVEFEAAHDLALERSEEGSRGLLGSTTTGLYNVFPSPVGSQFPPSVSSLSFSPLFTTESERRVTSFNTVAWLRHTLGARLDLAFVAGAAFTRTAFEQRRRLDTLVLPGFPPGVLGDFFPEQTYSTVSYHVGPVVGTEVWIAFGDRFHVVPGVRLSGVSGGWSVRPTVGAAWTF